VHRPRAHGNVQRKMMQRRLSSLLSLLLAAGCASTPTPPPAQPAAGAPAAPASTPAAQVADADKPLPLWSKVKRGRLPNGITYYLLHHEKPR
jgi:hypothetical protein